MPDKKPGGLKLKLRKADTNRLKTQTGRLKTESAKPDLSEAKTQAVPVPPQPAAPTPAAPKPPVPTAPEAEQTAEIRDPMALRDTSQGKLRRIQSPDETANAVSPAPVGDTGVKRETVRLKVVRDKKKGGPQIRPSAPPPPAEADAEAPPSAQTVKISLPGLQKKPGTPTADAAKSATSTIRVQEPPAGTPAGTLKVAPPNQESAKEYRETSTAAIKVGLGKPGDAPPAAQPTPPPPTKDSAAGTLKIKPGSKLALKKGQPKKAQEKQVTATLKVVGQQADDAEKTAAPEPTPAKPPANKQVTATLKIRGRQPTAEAESADTIKITPPQPQAAANEETETNDGAKPSLRLKKKPKKAPGADETVRVPLPIETGDDEDTSKTVALPKPPADGEATKTDETIADGPAVQETGKEAAEAEGKPEADAKPEPVMKPKPTSEGPGPISFVIRFAACGALGALVYRLVMDFLVL